MPTDKHQRTFALLGRMHQNAVGFTVASEAQPATPGTAVLDRLPPPWQQEIGKILKHPKPDSVVTPREPPNTDKSPEAGSTKLTQVGFPKHSVKKPKLTKPGDSN